MKKFNISILIVLLATFCSCSDNWNSHYSENDETITNDNVEISDLSLVEYLSSESDYSEMYQLFSDYGVIDSINSLDQSFTAFVVTNGTDYGDASTSDLEYLAQAHICDVSITPNNMYDGQRLLMWNGKYVNVAKDSTTSSGYSIAFNGSNVTKVIKVSNGYIYVLDSYVNTPKSLLETIENLSDDYSIFRDSVLSYNENTFDKSSSVATGVDATGNTIYDSVFTVTNPLFENAGMDITSESVTATMFIPSNDIINAAWDEAYQNLDDWGLTRTDSIITQWVFKSCFFDSEYDAATLESAAASDDPDIYSIFDDQWRLSAQSLDLDNPVSMSNGTAYYVTSMRIPTNVLIYRLKDFPKWYEYMSASEKSTYFVTSNLTFSKVHTDVSAWSPWVEAGWPTVVNRPVYWNVTDTTVHDTKLDFIPVQCTDNGDGTYEFTPYLVPPGEYDLCVGFKQKMAIASVDISVNDEAVGSVPYSTKTTYHYDRGSGGYPEGYDPDDVPSTEAVYNKRSNYDRDGGKVGEVTITGTEAVTLKITFSLNTGYYGTTKCYGSFLLNHWCLKPTENCY